MGVATDGTPHLSTIAATIGVLVTNAFASVITRPSIGLEPTSDSALSRSPGTSTSIASSSIFNPCAAFLMVSSLHEHPYASRRGSEACENFQALCSQFCQEKGLSRDVAARMSHAGCKPYGHQIGAHDHHRRNFCRRVVSGKNPGKCGCDENVNIKSDKFIRKRRQPGVVATGVAVFDMNVHA